MPEQTSQNLPSPSPAEFDDNDYGMDSTGYLLRRRQAAQFAANQGLDGESDNAITADNLSESTGDHAQLIYSNFDEYQRQHKALLTSELLKNNEALREYALAHPLNATISNNDWGQLDKVSEAIKTFGKGNILSAALDYVDKFTRSVGQAAARGGAEKFLEGGPVGSTVDEALAELKTKWPNTYLYFAPFVGAGAGAIELGSRAFSGALGAAHAALVEGQKNLGFDENHAVQRANEIVGMLENHL